MKKIAVFHRVDVIVALYIFFTITAELFGGKTFPLVNINGFVLNASVAIFAIPLVYSLSDIMLEVFGKKRARGLVFTGIGTVALLTLYAGLATALPPSTRFAPTEAAYDQIFNFSIRISLASIAAFGIAQLLDVLIFAKLRDRMRGQGLWLRNNVSNFISFFVDSLVFLTLAFYAFDKGLSDNAVFIIGLLIPYWLLKCSLSIIETPLVYAGVKWLKKDPELKNPK